MGDGTVTHNERQGLVPTDDILGEDWLDSFATEILDAKYTKTDIKDVVDKQNHLSDSQKKDISNLLNKHSKLFSDELGSYPHTNFHIDVDPGAKPVHL